MLAVQPRLPPALAQRPPQLNARGIRTARGSEWSAVQVQRVLERAV